MHKFGKRSVVVAVAAMVVLGSAGGAYAYWTTTGSGTGSATAGTVTTITAVQTSVVNGLAPGGAAQALSGTFNNPNTTKVYVAAVTPSILGVYSDAAMTVPSVGCDASDYTLGGAIAPLKEVATNDAWSGATIVFNNKPAANQNGCKNAFVKLSYTIS